MILCCLTVPPRKGWECALQCGSPQKHVLGNSLGKLTWLVLPLWWPHPMGVWIFWQFFSGGEKQKCE